MLWRGHCAIHSCWDRGCGTGPNQGKLELQLPKAAVGGLNRSLLDCMDLRTKRLEQAAAVGTVTTLLHLLISPVFVIQEGFKIGRTYKFVLHMSQDGHLPCPAVSQAHRHQFLPFNRDISENHTTKPALSPVTPVFPSLLQAVILPKASPWPTRVAPAGKSRLFPWSHPGSPCPGGAAPSLIFG